MRTISGIIGMVGSLGMAACAVDPAEMGREPVLSPVGTGIVVDQVGSIGDRVDRSRPVSRGSTWQDSAATLVQDPRAERRGDVLTITINMQDRASLDSSTERSRDATRSMSTSLDYLLNLFGISREGTGEINFDAEGATSAQGKGTTEREEKLNLRVAAVVTERLPNGNLVVSGSQEVRVNYELRIVHVAGIVRPRDISPDNTIPYEKIAEARISVGGRGRAMEVQQPAWGQQILDQVLPF
ncbi:MAG: flagellar basal body L-ring protein FlgH [Hyphomicrobium sp.]|jgi:flagellar L-ring protein precursor FlgH|nr:flagellar basal body L-ring protein FlgH [Hyphomicrobium sp.]